MCFIPPTPTQVNQSNKQAEQLEKAKLKVSYFSKVFCLQQWRNIYSRMFSTGHRKAVSYSLLIKILLHMLVPYWAAAPYLSDVNCEFYQHTTKCAVYSPISAGTTQHTQAMNSHPPAAQTVSHKVAFSLTCPSASLRERIRSNACNPLEAKTGMTKHVSK